MKQLASRAALPAVFRLGGRLTALSTLAFTAILALASAPNAAAQLAPPPAGGGYELYFDGKRVGVEPTWTFEQAIANLNGNRKKNPAKDIQGFFKGQPIVASGAGYELYFDGKRVGTEPSWTREQGVANLTWNRKTYPAKDVRGFHKGDELAAASEPREGVGYELFFDGKRVRTETEWTFAQGITNLNGNRQSHPGVNVQASYKGDKMVSSGIGYEVYYDGKRAGTQPKWTRDQGVASLTAIRKQYPQVDIRGFYSGQQLSPAAAPLPYVPKSPGFYIVNKTDWPLAISLNQVGCLYHDNINPGEVFVRDTGAVWFTIKASVNPSGKDPVSDWDCVKPVAAIVGAVALAAATGGYGAFAALPAVGAGSIGAAGLAGIATSSTVLVASGAAGGATVSLLGFGAKQLGDLLSQNGEGSRAGQYAGPPWPFRDSQMPIYWVTGGPSLTVDERTRQAVVGAGTPIQISKQN